MTDRLGSAIAAALDGVPHDVLITAHDSWLEPDPPPDGPWLPVHVEPGAVLIGPLWTPGRPGCPRCVRLRRALAREHPNAHRALLAEHGDELAKRPCLWLTDLLTGMVAALVAEDVQRHLRGEVPRTAGAILRVRLDTLEVGTHPFLPDPLCTHCGALPDDQPPAARRTERIPLAPNGYRVRSLADEHAGLLETYVDAETGVLRPLARWSEGGVVVAAAPMGLRTGDGTETGFGLGRSYHASEAAAIAEALERSGGIVPGGRRTVVHAAYRDVLADAVDPRDFGLYPPERYAAPDFPFVPFVEALPVHWVWGWSFGGARPVLVPEAHAYYHTRLLRPDEPRFAYEISNGCALGGCYEEAVLHGILEVAERDAFLLTWYNRVPAAELDLTSARGDTAGLVRTAIAEQLGYAVRAFDITTEHGIPAVWALAVDRVDGPDRPKALCAAAAHPDQERALTAALDELAPALGGLLRHYPARATDARAMAADPELVREMDDHGLLYACPEVFDRFDFLTTTTERRPLRPPPAPVTDLNVLLDDLLGRYLDTGMDVIAIDQTTPEHRAARLHCVKVLIPGTLPMTFGHDRRRITGLPRIKPDPNPHPHPFP